MELVIEILIDLIFDGSVEAASSRKAPVWLRVIAGLILFGVFAIILVVGLWLTVAYVNSKEILDLILGIALVALDVAAGFFFIKKVRKNFEDRPYEPNAPEF